MKNETYCYWWILITLVIIIAGVIYEPSIHEWWGKSKLWFVIFGELQLGVPFIVGVILSVIGLVILGI